MHNVLIYGGTFDPIHYGHLRTAMNVQNKFQFDQVLFIPCKTPTLKEKATATTEQRLDMLKLALQDCSDRYPFEVDTREITRTSPSYTILTLEELYEHCPKESAFTLLIGADSFYQLPKWHQWKRLLDYCHLLIIERTNYPLTHLDEALQTLLQKHETSDLQALFQTKSYHIIRFDAGHYPISSTAIRQMLREKQDVHAFLPKSVLDYISVNAIYTC